MKTWTYLESPAHFEIGKTYRNRSYMPVGKKCLEVFPDDYHVSGCNMGRFRGTPIYYATSYFEVLSKQSIFSRLFSRRHN